MKLRILLIAVHCLLFLNSTHAVEKSTFVKNVRTIIGNSTNNDKYWYGRYVQGKMDGNGEPVNDSYKYIYPEDDCSFEIRFSYLEKQNSSIPVYIYLSEINSEKTIKSELIGSINKDIKSSVKFKSDGVDIYTTDKHIHVQEDGMIIMYETKDGTYANGIIRIFQPSEMESLIYKVRYQVLVDKLKKLFIN